MIAIAIKLNIIIVIQSLMFLALAFWFKNQTFEKNSKIEYHAARISSCAKSGSTLMSSGSPHLRG